MILWNVSSETLSVLLLFYSHFLELHLDILDG